MIQPVSERVSEWYQVLNKCANSSPLEVFYKKDALRNIWKVYRRWGAPAKVFFSECCKIFEIIYFVKLLRVTASETLETVTGVCSLKIPI